MHLKVSYTFWFSLALLLVACNSSESDINGKLVNNADEFSAAITEAKPGDRIILANGTWTDTELKFSASGTEDKLIYIVAQEKGKVFFEGQSNLKMGGEYLHLEGLVFRNGFTPTSSVISLQKDKDTPCNHCRVTECVVDNYNPSERFDTDYWVEIYGKHNRFDHNYLVGKRNRGVTLAVRMKNEHDRENHHRIDHNYFGYHPILGSNGGETLRIGTSHYSLSNANTSVEDNYFERCNGEHEIISSKSCQNTFRNNTFFECQGTLTMRHGNETLVENNYFLGNRKANTGGIRIINETQTVRNNYLYGLTGYRFRGALVIMNGVPNSPLNRYFQVKDSDMSQNLVVDSDYIQLCAGSDEERSATPINTTFSENVILNSVKDDVFTIYDDVSGITFGNNAISSNIDAPAYAGQAISGINKADISIASNATNLTLADGTVVGPNSEAPMSDAENTGVSWYQKQDYQIHFKSGKRINVTPGENTLFEAMKTAEEGDILILEAGNYHSTRSIPVLQTVTIIGNGSDTKPVLTFERSPLFSLENGGSLDLENLLISGVESDDYSGNAVVRTSRYSMINNYKLLVTSCDIVDLDVNHSFNFLKVYKNTFADSILLRDCTFSDISGDVLPLNQEIEDIGIYNAEQVVIDNCSFTNIDGAVLDLYRGGRDESTFGPMLEINHSTFNQVGDNRRNGKKVTLALHGVQVANIQNSLFHESEPIDLHLVVGEPIISLQGLNFAGSSGPSVTDNEEPYHITNISYLTRPDEVAELRGTDGRALGPITDQNQ